VSRALKISIAILSVMVLIGLITLPGLRKAIEALSGGARKEEQTRREALQMPISTPTDVTVKAQMYWLSATSPALLEPTEIKLPLSENQVERSKQLVNALILKAPSLQQRTLPADVVLLALYIHSDGIAILDFSDVLSTGTPSGILSERRVVDSLAQTLGANVPEIRQIKILIHGQEAQTLAGHLDLTGIFRVPSVAPTSAQAPGLTPAINSDPAALADVRTASRPAINVPDKGY